MSTTDPALSTPEPTLLRLLRGIVAVGLALALTVIAALVILGCLPTVREVFAPLFTDETKLPKVPLTLALLFVVFVPALLLFWPLLRRAFRSRGAKSTEAQAPTRQERRSRQRWLSWTGLAVGWVLVIPVLIWLAHDEPTVRQPVTIEEFSPGFPGAEQSYAVLMQYSKQTPSEEAKAYEKVKLAIPAFGAQPTDGDKWVDFVAKNRAGLEADWETLAPQRRWLGELAAFDRIGDLTPQEIETNMMEFRLWRTLTYHLCGTATEQALDGHGDEAMATLIPLLEVSRKLQLSSRTLIRSVVAEVVERMSILTAGIVLDHASVSAATRRRLGAALANENAPVLARRLIMVDYVHFAPLYFSMKLGDAVAPGTGFMSLTRLPLNFLSALVLNPNATMNIFGDHVRELAELAENRDLGKFAVRHRGFGNDLLLKPSIKNLGGRLMINLQIPSFDKLLETHWKLADQRDALRKRVAGPA